MLLTTPEAELTLGPRDCPTWILPNAKGYYRWALEAKDFDALPATRNAAYVWTTEHNDALLERFGKENARPLVQIASSFCSESKLQAAREFLTPRAEALPGGHARSDSRSRASRPAAPSQTCTGPMPRPPWPSSNSGAETRTRRTRSTLAGSAGA
jgi:hypothetical protein